MLLVLPLLDRERFPYWRLVEVPGVGHDVEAMHKSPQADLALFGP
ncbi:MAG: hypothetical protein OEN48_12955 [Betaproteobacteria bacterium]|nr:hypothetical protein [Betaproteobacteria bacterium]